MHLESTVAYYIQLDHAGYNANYLLFHQEV